ncbi:MAG: DUF4214 domain-containing protein [Acidimicrobiales bacterium]
MKIRRSFAVGVGLAVLAPLAIPQLAGAEAPEAVAVSKADAWLHDQQQSDGGFEVAQFPGFETPDAVLALGAVGDGTWSKTEARTYVEAAAPDGKDGLDYLDDLIDGEADPSSVAAGARAAKVAALVAEPLGIDPRDFDPSDDSASAVDLLARAGLHQAIDGSYDFDAQFNGVLYTAIALSRAGEVVPAGLSDQIHAAQRDDGSWDYTGTTGTTGDDVDTTALALLSLQAMGGSDTDPDAAAGVAWLASRQQASGAWQAFGTDDPNSTSMAVLALSALGIDVTTSAWRATAGHPVSGTYTSPYAWLVADQDASGRFLSPNDPYGVNTFPTTQTMQALGRQWFLATWSGSLANAWSKALASPAAAPVPGNVDTDSSSFPVNPSVKAQRVAGAQAVVSSQVAREAAAADLFQQAFGRAIDPSGKAYWGAKLTSLTRPQVLARLTGSSEFYRRAGGTIPTFVDAVYQSVLGRSADPSGRAYWIGKLQKGASSSSVASSLVASNEFRRKQVDAAFARVLDRAPTSGERSYWTTKLATTRVEVLLVALAASAERYGTLPR